MRARHKLQQRQAEARANLTADHSPDLIAPYREKGALRRAWPTLGTDEKRAILRAVIDTVEIGPASGPGPIFDPDRISLTWRA